MHYNLFRYYDPNYGRFINQDPIGLSGGDNLYQFAPNANGWVDPLGLWGFVLRLVPIVARGAKFIWRLAKKLFKSKKDFGKCREKVLKGAKRGNRRSEHFKEGGLSQANKDFDSFDFDDIEEWTNKRKDGSVVSGRTGTNSNGNKVTVRDYSNTTGGPTLEIWEDSLYNKIRY